MAISDHYLEKLKKRAKESRAYTKHQLVGVELAELLRDKSHISLYIKLAKERNPDNLLRIAKTIAEQKNIKNKGAYFMSVVSREKE